MTLLDLFGYLLVVLAVTLAIYSLRCVCRARKAGRDPRPFAVPVFTLLAFATIQGLTTATSNRTNDALSATWLAVELAQLISIGWLLYHATKRRTYR